MEATNPALSLWLERIPAERIVSDLAGLDRVEAVIVIDEAFRILLWNRAAEDLFGVPEEQALGRSYAEIVRLGEPLLAETSNAGEVPAESLDCEPVPGQVIRVHRRARAYRADNGRFLGELQVFTPALPQSVTIQPPVGDDIETLHGLITRDAAMKQAFRIIHNVAESEATVLIRGESGTGKELVARALHAGSHRRNGPFLAINCAALSQNLLESELFGHVRGAFTGAVKDHAGVFQRADGGTLFLDEVAELPLELQAKLLRVLQERSFLPVGGDRPVRVDVRIVAATHRSLREAVKAGRFREDLMYRLRVVPIFLPPLRQRRSDVALLLRHFIELHNAAGTRRIERIEPDAMKRLLDHPWPGNVRELQNVVEYAFAVGREENLRVEDLPPEFREENSPEPPSSAAAPAPEMSESDRILEALRLTHGRIDDAARRLGVSRATFWRKRRKHGL